MTTVLCAGITLLCTYLSLISATDARKDMILLSGFIFSKLEHIIFEACT